MSDTGLELQHQIQDCCHSRKGTLGSGVLSLSYR